MKSLKWLLAVSVVIMSTHFACGNRYREASSGKSASEVNELLVGLQSSQGGTSPLLQNAIQMLRDNPDTVVYFSEAPGEMGPIHAVLPLDYSFVNPNLSEANLELVRAYFLDLLVEGGGHKAYLIIEYKIAGETASNYKVFSNESLELGKIVDGEFTVVLKDESNQMILVRSFDTDDSDEDIAETIQLEISEINASGQEGANFGQISSMESFSILY